MAREEKPVVEEVPGLIPFGSPGHRALLGLDDEDLTPERKAQLEKAFNARPVPSVDPKRKRPITRETYRPQTRRSPGDPIVDGWVRKGS